MDIVFVVIGVLFVAAVVVWWAMSRGGNRPVAVKREDRVDTLIGWPPQATRILTSGERAAWSLLNAAMPGYMILAQVPVARFTRVPTRNSYSEWLRRIGTHCADLLVCDMASHVIAVVHVQAVGGEPNPRAQRRIARMKRVLDAEGIRTLTWTEGALPSAEAAREALIGQPSRPPGQPDTIPSQVPTASGADTAAPPVAAPAPAKPAGPSPFDDSRRDSTQDERIELSDAPPSTWFDDLDTAPAPLDVKPAPPRGKPRP